MSTNKLITILLPCLNEEKTILTCIRRIKKVMNNSKYKKDYNILVCDNGSNDNSIKLLEDEKIEYVICQNKGYGNTLINGINKANSKYLVMLDCDFSYNENDIPKFIKELENGFDLVVGNRLNNIEKKAMSLSHKIGVRFLTSYANLLFHIGLGDYHCGLRAFKKDKILKCNLNSFGFEFASEMIIKAKLNKLKIKEVKTNLFKDKRGKKSHLHTIRDGLRHLHLINKIKFETSSFFRYTTTFIFLILFMFSSLLIVSLIPQKIIYHNTAKSFEFFEKYAENNIFSPDYVKFEKAGEMRNISMAYNMSPKKALDSVIRMSYQENIDYGHNMKEVFLNKDGKNINYSRYWQGQAMYMKIMLVFMPLGHLLYSLQFLVLFVLLIIVLKKLFFINKKLAISFLLMNIGINALFTAFLVQYFFAILLMYIFSLIVIHLYQKNSNYIGLMFAISASITCFFDFLTCETIVLSVPLFIYIFLLIEDGRKVSVKEILKYIFLWGVFYSLTFITKWLISISYFGISYFSEIMDKAFIRIDSNEYPIYIRVLKAFLLSFDCILPLALIKKASTIFIIILIVFMYLFIFEYEKYYPLFIICLIPFIRYILISTHSISFYYFTYRAFGVLLLLMNIVFISTINILWNKKKKFN